MLRTFLFAIGLLCTRVQCEEIIVNTSNGRVQGKSLLDWDKNPYFSFTNIPYAKPPLGELRFKAPQPVASWTGLLDATQPAMMCPQFQYDQLIGVEDCLHLNIYTPTLDASRKLPVMFYIHGGGYFVGTGSSLVYGAEFLMTANVVLVTIEYRLGYLGALSFKDQTQGVPGNALFKDQVMALKWVRDNIQRFGGDPNLITAFGESAGGASVHMHMLSPMSTGLVHRVIAQSGAITMPWNRGELGTGDRIAHELGLRGSTKEIIAQLQKMPMEEFVKKTQFPGELTADVHKYHPFSPVVESQTNEPAFIPKPPLDLITTAANNEIPIMFGYDNNDTIIFQVQRRIYKGQPMDYADLATTIPADLNIPNEQERAKVINEIKTTFFDGKDVTMNTNIGQTLYYSMGPWFISGYVNALPRHLAAKHNVYFYIFSSDTKLNFFKRLHPVTALHEGASHMDELGHLLTTQYTQCFDKGSKEDKAMRTMVKIWTHFARTGRPVDDNASVEWKPLRDSSHINYVDINIDQLTAGNEPDKKSFEFWRGLYARYNHVKVREEL